MAFLSRLFDKSEASALGIDIGSSAIKMVQIKRKNGQAILETYGELALGPYANQSIGQAAILPPDKITQAVIDLMNEKEVNITTKKCGVAIPFASSLMTVIEMPEVSPKQLSFMVPLEARKYVPVPISEVMLDWSVIPKNEPIPEDHSEPSDFPSARPSVNNSQKPESPIPRVDVLVVAIHNETIARYRDIVTRAGLEAGFFEIEIFSTMRTVIDEGLRPVMIMDIGAASTKLYIVERGIIRLSHTINRGSQDITMMISKSLGLSMSDAEIKKRTIGASGDDQNLNEVIALSLDYIFAEANHTLLSFEKRYNKTISKVVMVGGGSALKGLAVLAKDNFKTEVVPGNPFGKLSTPAFLDSVLRDTGPEFAVAIGLALRKLAEEK